MAPTGRHPRHAALNDIIKRTCSSINVPTILEPKGMFRSDRKRADGLSLIPWSRGKCLLWDATCVDPCCASYLYISSKSAGAAAAHAEEKKRDLYHEVTHLYHFVPFAVETLGVFGEEALLLVKELGSRLQESTGEPRSTAFLTQRLSIAIQIGNAASILATTPISNKFYEIYYL